MNIKLTQRKVAIIDDSMAHLLKCKWRFNGRYAITNFTRDDGTQRVMFLHHAIIGYPLKDCEVDHINGIKLDCRKNNLRIVTHRENMSNLITRRNGKTTSKFTGVCWHKQCNKWRAYIWINGKQKSLGLFKKEEDASFAYQKYLDLLK